jgi:hypothetical protein
MDGGINFWTNLRIADTQWCLDAGERECSQAPSRISCLEEGTRTMISLLPDPRAGSTPKLKCCSGEASQRWWYRYTKFILSEPGPNNECE